MHVGNIVCGLMTTACVFCTLLQKKTTGTVCKKNANAKYFGTVVCGISAQTFCKKKYRGWAEKFLRGLGYYENSGYIWGGER
jgi:hypothetical protein